MDETLSELITYYKKQKRHYDLSRGKPSKEQLSLSEGLLTCLSPDCDLTCKDKVDCRNYGLLDGIPEMKEFFSKMLNVNSSNVLVYGNSSLSIMYSLISKSFTHGVNDLTPWSKEEKIKWLCPVPGYDRHFSICEYFNIEMVNIPLKEDGPDMDLVEEYIKDPTVKGIWCVPKYSNPSGICYSDEVVRRFAKLKPAAKDFRVYWDNAYCVHDLYKEVKILEIFSEAKKYNNEDLFYEFASTSKITFPGSGVAALVTSDNNIKDIKKQLKIETIGFDKMNQLRHIKFLPSKKALLAHMKKQADLIRPKFELIDKILKNEVSRYASWNIPKGGYFVTISVPGKADTVTQLASVFGLRLCEVGSCYPYHSDPTHSLIRIAPTALSLNELEAAIKILVVCIKLSFEK